MRQGYAMPPCLLNVYMDHTVREMKERFSGGAKLEEGSVQVFLFADDLMLLAEKEEDGERNLRILEDVMAKWNIMINWG